MSNKNPNEISKLWKNAVDWPCHDGPHTYNGIHADTYINSHCRQLKAKQLSRR